MTCGRLGRGENLRPGGRIVEDRSPLDAAVNLRPAWAHMSGLHCGWDVTELRLLIWKTTFRARQEFREKLEPLQAGHASRAFRLAAEGCGGGMRDACVEIGPLELDLIEQRPRSGSFDRPEGLVQVTAFDLPGQLPEGGSRTAKRNDSLV